MKKRKKIKDSSKRDRKCENKKHCLTETEGNEKEKKSGINYRGPLQDEREILNKLIK
jgi:hypothetical protein